MNVRHQTKRELEGRIGPKRSDKRLESDVPPGPISSEPTEAPEDEHRALARETRALEELVEERLETYVAALQGHYPRDLYALILPQLERPLIRVAMRLAEGRQSLAAEMLGIHRNTLRARIRELGLEGELHPKPRR